MRLPARLKLIALASVALFVAANLASVLDLRRTPAVPPVSVQAGAPPPGVALLGRATP